MIIYKEIQTKHLSPQFFICDRCKKQYSYEEDMLDIQESHKIKFTGGYASVFGDGNMIECDLCQDCLSELIKDFCRKVGEAF